MDSKEQYPNRSIDLSDPIVRHKYISVREILDENGDSAETIKNITRAVVEATKSVEDSEDKSFLGRLKSLTKSKSLSNKKIITAAVKDYRAYMKETGWERM